MGDRQLIASITFAATTTQPFSVEKVGPGQLHPKGRPAQVVDGLSIESVGAGGIGTERLDASGDPERPFGRSRRGP
jgi:hypothetical protein